jgi:hypothetical protein
MSFIRQLGLRRMAGVCHESSGEAPVCALSDEQSRSGAEPVSIEDDNDGIATFYFDSLIEQPALAGVSSAQQDIFKADFYRELASLKKWSIEVGWRRDIAPALQIFVSTDYKISKSLVPAWSGRAGHMEFPAWRVIAGKAAIAHELTHVYFPNGNRFLAEGLAVYLQAEIGGNPAFPNFGRPLHQLVGELLQEMVPEFVPANPQSHNCTQLSELDEIATPSPLTLKIGQDFYGEEPRGQARIYPIAGSFVQFLIETRGMEKFGALYSQTPLVSLVQTAGTPDRWCSIYGISLTELEQEWKSLIAHGYFQHHHKEYGYAQNLSENDTCQIEKERA